MRQRVLGWDLLRGLCALAVALYHLTSWSAIADVPALGSYGVYLFFVLSGASLAYNHADGVRTPGAFGRFLLARWARLAPLYALVCVLTLWLYARHNGAWVDDAARRLAWNIGFAFGFDEPAVSAIAIGGWSLGIEAVFYLAFPWLAAAAARPRWALAVGAALALVQFAWIGRTIGGPAGYAAGAVAYHQAPAFIAYFFIGCAIGAGRRTQDRALSWHAGALACTGLALLLFLASGPRQGDELLGWRAPAMLAACCAVVWVFGHLRVAGRMAFAAQWLGDATYGCYLLHPLLFFSLAWFVLPLAGIADVSESPVRWLLLSVVLVLSVLLAVVSERWFERPVRRVVTNLHLAGKAARGRAVLRGRGIRRQSRRQT